MSKTNQLHLVPGEEPHIYYYGEYQIELVFEEDGDSLELLLLEYLKNQWGDMESCRRI